MKYAKSVELYAAARKCIAGGVNSNFRYDGWGASPVPLFYERGAGSHLYDVDGNVFIDYACANGPTIHGNAPKPLLDAVRDTLEMGQTFAGQIKLEVDLAQTICDIIPCAELVRFASSGSEVDQAAIRLARAYTGRKKIIKFEGHYHGWFDNLYISVGPSLDEAGPADAPRAVAMTPGQSEFVLADTIILPWNDIDVFRKCVTEHGDDIAGVIMEPIVTNKGAMMPREGYLEGVREITAKAGIVLIFDEVITGFRVGLSGAQGHFGVTPDLATFAKSAAGGFPLAFLAGRSDIMELFETKKVMHAGTYNANTVSVAAGIASINELLRGDGSLFRQMEERGRRLMSGIGELAAKHGERMLVSGLPTMFQTVFTDRNSVDDYRAYMNTDTARQKRLSAALHEVGVRLTPAGTWFMSTAHTDDDIDFTLQKADQAFSELKNGSPS